MNKEAAAREAELHKNLIQVAKTAQAVINYTQDQRKQALAQVDTIVSMAKKASLIDDAGEARLRGMLDSHSGTMNVTQRLLEEITNGNIAKRAAGDEKPRGNGYAVSPQDKKASVNVGGDEDYISSLSSRYR